MPELEGKSKARIGHDFRWLRTGELALNEMLQAIRLARSSIRLEMYIFHESAIASEFRRELINACQRGLRVRVLIDALGSFELPESYWDTFRSTGGEFRWFNPLTLGRLGLRDHRKILVIDGKVAFIGGLNIAEEYSGDGVRTGWRDLGLRISGPVVEDLINAFEEMYAIADFKYKRFVGVRKARRQRIAWHAGVGLFLSAPGRERNPMKDALQTDFRRARKIQIVCAYFLPTWRLRNTLMRVARRGAKVQLILPGKSDVPMMQMASRGMYRRLLRAGVEIYEYEPQILHAKLIVVDEAIVYAGSANLDIRSLHLNYELLVRLQNRRLAREAGETFERDLRHCRRIDASTWLKERNFWERFKSRLATFIFTRLDPYIVNWQLSRLFRRS